MCPYPTRDLSKKVDMDFSLFKSIIDKLVVIDTLSISLSGFGDPLLWKYLPDAIEYIKQKKPDALVVFNTNGVALNAKWAEKLIVAGLDHMCISVNGADRDTYKKVQGVDAFEKTVKGTIDFLEARNKNIQFQENRKPDVRVQVLETDEIRPLIPGFYKFWSNYITEEDEIYTKKVTNWGGTVLTELYKPNLALPKRFPCPLIFFKLFIDASGIVYMCDAGGAMGADNELRIGHVNKLDFMDIDNNPKIKKLLDIHLKEHWGKSACGSCADWHFRGNVFFKNYNPFNNKNWF